MGNDNKKMSQPVKDEDARKDQPPPDARRDGQSGAQAGNPGMKHKTATPEDLARLDDDGGAKKPPRD